MSKKGSGKAAELRKMREAQFKEQTESGPEIDPEFRALVPPLRPDELSGLEESIRAEGCRDPIVVWAEKGILLDGHNRFAICEEHGIPYRTVTVSLPDRAAALDWIDANALNRRNLTPDQMRMIRGRRYNRTKKDRKENLRQGADDPSGQNGHSGVTTAEKLADEHGVSERTIRRDGKAVEAVEDDPEIVREVTTGSLSLAEGARRSKLKRKVESFPEDERERAGAFLRRVVEKGNHTSAAVELADNLLAKPEEERVRIYVLAESDDPQEQSLALTEAAGLPPMPHPALSPLRDAARSLAAAERHLSGTFDGSRVANLRSEINELVSRIKESAA